MRDGGRRVLGKNLGLRKKRGSLLAWWNEEDGELGRLKGGFPTRRKRPKDLVNITNLP